MQYPEITYPKEKALGLDHFREMDYFAVNQFGLPIELMMENAGLQLANLAAGLVEKDAIIQMGIGNGNNGGGGLVAARRLAAWGYTIYLDIYTEIIKPLPSRQLERALRFGVQEKTVEHPALWIDAYLGFSQRLPLPDMLAETIRKANRSHVKKLSLDIPTGFLGDVRANYFKADKVLTLAAPKTILYQLPMDVELFVADLGIPEEVYARFGAEKLPFDKSNIIRLKR